MRLVEGVKDRSLQGSIYRELSEHVKKGVGVPMAMFEFECKKCGKRFEELLRADAGEESPVCPECGGESRKLISAPAVVFKGKGFHCTDYRKRGRKT
jgi:putative FmdB family regulatory protein